MPRAKSPDYAAVPDFTSTAPQDIKDELVRRGQELTRLEIEQTEIGTAAPAIYSSIGKYIANPSTVSVETYKRMLDTDETIGSATDFMNLAMIARMGDYKHPSEEITAFVKRALDNMDDSWHECLDEMFSAEWAGFSLTEKVWKFDRDFDGMAAFVPQRLATMPPLTIVFAVDRNGGVLPDGIKQYQRYGNTSNLYTGGTRIDDLGGFRPDLYASRGDMPYPIRIAQDVSYMTVDIPREKVIHLKSSSTGKFRNPYGRSIYRRIYKNWVLKDAFLKMWVIAADRRGTPLLVGYAPPNDTVHSSPTGDASRYSFHDAQGSGPMRADEAMNRVFQNLSNAGYIVLPGKKGEQYEVESIQQTGDMNIYKDGAEYFNKAMMRGMLIPPLVMSAGDGSGSYALGEAHHKIFGQTVDGKLKGHKAGILKQFIQQLIAYNFPRKLWERDGVGDFILEEYDTEVMEKLSNIYGTLTDRGYMSPSDQADMDFVRQKLGNLPPKAAVEDPNSAIDLGSGEGDEANEPVPTSADIAASIDNIEDAINPDEDVDDTDSGS